MEKAKVYFTKALTPETVISMYEVLGIKLPGKVAVKVHSGEEGNQNYLRPEFLRPMIETVQGTVVECNTAYDGARNSTEKHRKLLADHLWTKYFQVDLLDAEGPDLILPVKNGKVLKENHVGRGIANYDSIPFQGPPGWRLRRGVETVVDWLRLYSRQVPDPLRRFDYGPIYRMGSHGGTGHIL